MFGWLAPSLLKRLTPAAGVSRTASPNIDTTLQDALSSLQSQSTAASAGTSPGSAISQGIDDSSGSPSQTSPFAAPGASEAAFGDLSKAEADKTIAASLRRTLNRLNTLSLPVALVTAKSDALPPEVSSSATILRVNPNPKFFYLRVPPVQ